MNKRNNPRADDHFALKAKKEGYPARSVYKLMEIQKKFAIFRSSSRILDIGAAPGSWSLYILRQMSDKGSLTAVDLLPLEIASLPAEKSFFFIQGDAFSDEILNTLSERGVFDAVLSDAAPSTTGIRAVDTERSFQLASSVLDLAETVLAGGGNLVIKIFQGGEEKKITERMKKLFTAVKSFKPESVRKESFETYLIGLGRKGRFIAGGNSGK